MSVNRNLLLLRLVGVSLALSVAGCAHLTPYYEANIDGHKAVTEVGCFGPSSSVELEPAPGISVSAYSESRPMNGIKLRVEIYSDNGGQFAFANDTAVITSPAFSEPLKIQMEKFTADYGEKFVAGPTDLLVIKPNRRFDTYIKSRSAARNFDLQLPDARAGGRLISFPTIHFRSALKAYIGVCEA